MIFHTPNGVTFEIPDEWWEFADMPSFKPRTNFYLYPLNTKDVQIVPLAAIEPLRRDEGTPLFVKSRLVPVLFGLQQLSLGALPPIELHPNRVGPFSYRIRNGCHRYFASVAAGYTDIPAFVFEPFSG